MLLPKNLKVSIRTQHSSFNFRWNQTSGNDYVYSFDAINKVYPLIVGDTTFLFKINQLNVINTLLQE
jgi:hypothetical protein